MVDEHAYRHHMKHKACHFVRQNSIEFVIVQAHHPLQPLELVILECTTNKEGRLFGDPLGYAMGDGVVIYPGLIFWGFFQYLCTKGSLVRWTIFCFKLQAAMFTLLCHDSLREGIKIRVRLSDEMGDASILGGIDKLHICLFIVGFERLQTLLGDALDTLLLLLFSVYVEVDNSSSETRDTILSLSAY